MDLFEHDPDFNLLPYDGEVNYFGVILSPSESTHYLDHLLNAIEWKNDEVIIAGKHITTKRKAAWYGDERYAYSYSNTTKHALPWTTELLLLKDIVEQYCGKTFNSCLLNLYHNGDEGMTWHCDDEKMLGVNTTIASLSFGSERKFSFKHKSSRQTISIDLQQGSLLIMKGTTQTHWLHSLPKTKKSTSPRVNLTFRTIVN
ncbi:MAG: alpha-ketoglutarate-dependent dioxygenase AlkB [Gammaproteobacteria bacterium]|jgi:alkylated DNA repair dioxygenase AlkB|nr:alpha-ketoglutarate-dependent dioxygenase AlkB [Gammaproteobacteria bacterium]MBT3725287.1 alpha-ketoglutarate-dependent dioxygenase AlkB [Gammaproteobacteria bacterium]MBT4077495.1 alpha-ketoglutarate-dependent dioxygenase AlkB [Gammaproteobacteria bacterium]MBT4195333.1 alpha-ketoglutarate-dependent dioxygenase AlkB [Gammaproteobacteria bacterium]MBT4449636.1 alpha-ketoglutarate-dependent dioxygenase AlkB [Gammaproteobacteria bacterium]